MVLIELLKVLDGESVMQIKANDVVLFKGTKYQFQKTHVKNLPNITSIHIRNLSILSILEGSISFPTISIILDYKLNFNTGEKKTIKVRESCQSYKPS